MPSPFIYELGARRLPPRIGSKARGLHFLIRNGWQVPVSYACTWDAHLRYREDDPDLLVLLKSELEQKLDANCLYAVRSSGNVEDGPEHSFAGQFKTILNVQGTESILKAMQSIWAATLELGIQTYLDKSAIEYSELRMAVVIQEMVQPCISGVSFSKNPMTGLDEVIVEAVAGSGDALVQEGATPMRWVNKWGAWIAKPDVQEPKLEVLEEVVQKTKLIAKQYGRPVDLEWVFDGREVNWVQLREITSVDIPIYSNRISKEVFPGIIKPLVWSVNVPLVNGAWVVFLTELVGPGCIDPDSLVKRFYSRAYFNMRALGRVFERLGLPKESLELLMGIEVEGPERPSFKPSPTTYMLLPRLLRFGLDKARFARRIEANLPLMEARFRAVRARPATELTDRQLLEEIDSLYPLAQETAYYNIVTALLMRVYGRLLQRQLDGIGIEYEDLEMNGGTRDLRQFEPNTHLARLHQQYNELDEGLQADIQALGYRGLHTLAGTESLRLGLERFLERFGHLSDSGSDFSCETWREDPDLVLQMTINYTPTQNGDRQKIPPGELGLTGLRRPFFMSVYKRARQFQWYREAASSLYTYGYGLFRDHFLELGERFAGSGILRDREDIFFLYLDEVREIVEAGGPVRDCQALIRRRKEESDRTRDLVPPDIVYGNQAPPLQPHQGEGLKGIATSRGHYTGPARILRGIRDFNKLQEGDVLVIPYSDVGWTPLFTKAGAVIAESGGILSHSSIIAREYGIPAVVSVPTACQIADDTLVTVDGYRGQVILHESG